MESTDEKMCKWYSVCPMKFFYEQGQLEKYWINQYCFGNCKACVRYEMEETGKSHPDNMLPDGSVDDQLVDVFRKK